MKKIIIISHHDEKACEEDLYAIKKIDYFYVVNSIISLIIMFGFGYLEPFGAITPNGMRILGIFLSLIYGWTTVGTFWLSMIAFLLWALQKA